MKKKIIVFGKSLQSIMQPPNRRNSQPERPLPFICSLEPQAAAVTNPFAWAAAALTQISRDPCNGSLRSV